MRVALSEPRVAMPACAPRSVAQPCCLLPSLCSDVSVQLTQELSKHLKATLVTADLHASINAAVFPDDTALQPSHILRLDKQALLTALRPKGDFLNTLGKLDPPRIVLRPHHCDLLRVLRRSLKDRAFSVNDIHVYSQCSLVSSASTTLGLLTDNFRTVD